MQTRSIQTKSRILHAAQALFSRSGYESASVADICASAGVSKGAFYHHFPSKQAVFMELLDEWLKGIDLGLAGLRSNQSDPSQAIIQMTEILPTILAAAKGGLPIFLEFWAHAVREPDLWKIVIAPLQKYQEYFTRMIDEGAASGIVIGNDPKIASISVLALAIGLLLQGMMDPAEQDWSRIGREGMNYLMEGMTRRSK